MQLTDPSFARNDNVKIDPPPPSEPAPKRPGLAEDLVMALRFFSRLPTGDAPHEVPVLDRIARALPLASVIIGAIPVAVLMGGTWLGLPAMVAATLAVASAVIIGGAMAEDGLADAADGLFGGQTVERRLEILKDSRHGTYGVAALCLFLVLRVVGLGSMAALSPLAAGVMWLSAMVLARSGSLWISFALPPARQDGASASAGQVGRTSFVIGMVLALLIGLLVAVPAVGPLGFVLGAACGALVIWGWSLICRRLLGGQTGDVIGAAQALAEMAVLCAYLAVT